VNIQCHAVIGDGENSSTIEGATVDVSAAARFSLICNKVVSKYDTAIKISSCDDIFLRITNVESGSQNYINAGAPVMLLEGSGSMYINQLSCTGYGSCLVHKDGIIGATITGIYTYTVSDPDPSEPTVLLDGGTEDQELVLYFGELKNFNSNSGVAVRITEGKASLIGRSIFCTSGKSLDLTGEIVSAYFECDEIISLTEGINIENSDQPIVIQANYIEGSDGNDAVVKCNDLCNLVLRNAKIKNTTESTSIGIYITDHNGDQLNELENLIIVTGTVEDQDYSIFRDGSNNIDIKNLLLFVKQPISNNITLLIGDENNFKYIVDPVIF